LGARCLPGFRSQNVATNQKQSSRQILPNSHHYWIWCHIPSSNSPHKGRPQLHAYRHSHCMTCGAWAVPVGHRRNKHARPCPVPRTELVLYQLACDKVHGARSAAESPPLHSRSNQGITSPINIGILDPAPWTSANLNACGWSSSACHKCSCDHGFLPDPTRLTPSFRRILRFVFRNLQRFSLFAGMTLP